jgi:ADP-heptose:LPS heptosyltransferase
MKKLILVNYLSPGDLVMLTAAVRDLHRCHPGEFLTDVRTGSPELWENNPYLTPLSAGDPEVETLVCHYPLIQHSNQRPVHFIHGFIEFLNEQLGLRIRPSHFGGDIHLSPAEAEQPSPVAERIGESLPYWIVVGGGKLDITIKWWHTRRWQAVVDHFRDRLLFVQVGEKYHYHPALSGVLDLRGRTPLRDLIRLMHHAQGVICPVTSLMHLAAAVEYRPPPGGPPQRPCVVVAGGREPATWEAYPGHEFLHTIGQLSCCATGGCWRARSVALGDGDGQDDPSRLCLEVVDRLPRCMDSITPEMVVDRIESYFRRYALPRLTRHQAALVAPHLRHDARQELFEQIRGGLGDLALDVELEPFIRSPHETALVP